jgi:TrpR-related protein YerC/YecD
MERELKKDPRVKELFEVIVHLEDPEECARFFRDLCTLTELKAMAERWQVVQLVSEDIPYREISERTGASTATITRIAHWLKYGEDGYRFMLERVREKNEVRR